MVKRRRKQPEPQSEPEPQPEQRPQPVALPPVSVDGRPYARYVVAEGEVVVVPGVDGTDELPEIPPQVIPFHGVGVVAGVRVVQDNHFVGEGENREVVSLTEWGITLNGVLVYAPLDQPHPVGIALLRASQALPRLLAHPVLWWMPSSWQGRRVYCHGVPSTIEEFRPASGQVLLRAETGFTFPPAAQELEDGADPWRGGRHAVLVDILSPSVMWSRTRVFVGRTDSEDAAELGDHEREESQGADAGD